MSAPEARLGALTHDALLRKNVLLNLAAWGIPAVAALLSIPLLTRGLGAGRFGLVALAWGTIGLFSMFDFGLGRAVTRLVAERLASGRDAEIPRLVWTMTWMLLGLGATLGLSGAGFAVAITDRVLDIPAALRGEAIGVVVLLAVSIPALAHGVALRGVLEAAQEFGAINRLRIPLGLVTYLGPLLALPLGGDARVAVGTIVAGRIAYWIAHFPLMRVVHADLGRPLPPTRAAARELVRVGGWISVSNLVSPVIVHVDRLVVAAALPIAASGLYGASAEIATKQWLFTAALQPVFFSAMAAALRPAPRRAAELMDRATIVTMTGLLPAVLMLVAFAEPLLTLWMGPAYAPEAGTVLRWLAIAVYVNALAQVPYAVLQSGVDVRLPAILHLVELPLYAALLYSLTVSWGLTGIAIAWFLRMALDGAAMWAAALWKFPEGRAVVRRRGMSLVLCLTAIAAAALWGAGRW